MTEESFNNYFYSYATQVSGLEEENKLLKQSLQNLEGELRKYKKTPLISCEVRDIIKDNALIRLPNGNEFFVEISSKCEPLSSGDWVLAEQKNLTVIKKIGLSKRFNVEKFVIIEKPEQTWNNIGGLKKEIEELKEVVEYPLTKPELFKEIGINPPKGVLLHGPPGTGKTILAKAVANSTNSTFIQIVGSELVQKFIGEGAKLVNEIFSLAKEKTPAIIFIDELDAIAASRIDVGTSGEREVQRTFMQLLAEIDGFKSLGNVKIIGCTNRIDILDSAILRPGRLDRLIEVPLPDEEGIKEIFKIHTRNINLENIDIDELVKLMTDLSGAEIQSIVTEAGYFAIRDDRKKISQEDFIKAIEKVKIEEDESHKEMFG
ncbi:proteasome-activating nucleotidase [Candidatus Woesearchaeota archaeon CG10_big_fil_rev_8_21_14_0_10_30_7]|nr:MAG: proteasome-activating nucleotidase [Candidatus Woesearchaeota archaeon CG10_big_fil_rev_8_21_14_0_10_30_7]